ncbi:MAG TPA: histone deacetylase [Gemmataceae bacterium]|nr:histone deacetylase [Gemmataceae bacterium]
MTMLFSDPVFLKHETGQHPENSNRLRSITSRLEESGLASRCQVGVFQPLAPEGVAHVHAPTVIQRVKEVAEQGGGMLDVDTIVSSKSYEAGLAAAGAGVAAVDAVLSGKDKTALCLIRPPGHHATPTHSMGFCLFNNIALAADHARRVHQLDRILILDWDVHHGNGTQDVFYEDPEILFLSIHRFGVGFYPGTGAADETGSGRGLGFTANVPIRYGTSRKDYLAAVKSALDKAADKIKPELVLVSAGFDAHRKDPIGSLGLETEDFSDLTKMALDVARTHAQGRLVSCLEGGYDLVALAESVQVHLEELLTD